MYPFKNEHELNLKFGANDPNANYRQNNDGSSQMYGFTSSPQQEFNSPEMAGSIQRNLAQNLGEYVVIEFLIGTCEIVRKQGLLYTVATTFVVLFDDTVKNFILCDIFSIKFIYFYSPGDRPNRNYNILDGSAALYSSGNTRNQRR